MALNVKVSVESNFKFNEFMGRTNSAIKDGLTLAGIRIKGQAVLLADFTQGYQTGFLKNSLSYSIDGKRAGANENPGEKVSAREMVAVSNTDNTVHIGTNVEYADYVERGTSRMSAQPYLRPAYDMSKSDVEKLVKIAIANHLKGLL